MVLSIINNKGGTGKTTTSINLAFCLADKGHKVLLIDLDPQSYACFSLGIDYQDLRPSIHSCMSGEMGIKEVIRKTEPLYNYIRGGTGKLGNLHKT